MSGNGLTGALVEWGPEVPRSERFNKGRKLYINRKLAGEFYQHEEDGSRGAVENVLRQLAAAGAIEYAP